MGWRLPWAGTLVVTSLGSIPFRSRKHAVFSLVFHAVYNPKALICKKHPLFNRDRPGVISQQIRTTCPQFLICVHIFHMCAIWFICLFKNRIPKIHPTRLQKLARSRLERSPQTHVRPSAAVSTLSVRSAGGVFHAGRHAGPAQRFRIALLQFRFGAHLQCHERHLPWPLWGLRAFDYAHPLPAP